MLQINTAVTWKAYCQDAQQYLKNFDVLVLPSQFEGFGRVLIEAMAAGVAVIGAKVGGIQEIIEHQQNGLLVEYGDVKALANAIKHLATCNDDRARMIKHGFQTITSRFSEHEFFNQLNSIYKSQFLQKMASYDVVFIISDLDSGGAQRVLSEVVQHWCQNHLKIALVTIANREHDFYRLPPAVDRYVLDAVGSSANIFTAVKKNFQRFTKLRKILKQHRAKAIISFLCATNVLSIIATRGLNTKLIISERNDPSKQAIHFCWDFLRRFLYRFADVVTANTHAALQAMQSYVPTKKLQWIPNPIYHRICKDTVHFNQPTILAVGRLHKQKAYDILLRAFAAFHQHYPDWQLVILGEGPLKTELCKLANQLQISPFVRLQGRVANPFPYYYAAQFFVMPSRYEGMPNALLEAIQSGLPVIISDAMTGPMEYIQHEETGLVVPVEDSQALAFALSRYVSDEKFRAEMAGAAAATEILTHHSVENVMATWNALINDNTKGLHA